MPIFDNYPRADLHEMNLDWLLKTMKALVKEIEDLKQNGLKPIEGEIQNIDNSIIIINNEIQNLYNLFGFFVEPVNIKDKALEGFIDDSGEIEEVDL